PFVHWVTPFLQWLLGPKFRPPMPGGVQGVLAMPSSTSPLQSSSIPLHVSAGGVTAKVHAVKPAPATQAPGCGAGWDGLQVMVPWQYAGVVGPGVGPQGMLTLLRPLSMVPSQSLSQPSQVSAA